MAIYKNNNGTAERVDGTGKADLTMLGTVELAETAQYAHAVGEYFIFIGQFVKVTSAIAVGDTIAVGTNVAATTVGAVLAEANNKIAVENNSPINVRQETIATTFTPYFLKAKIGFTIFTFSYSCTCFLQKTSANAGNVLVLSFYTEANEEPSFYKTNDSGQTWDAYSKII